MRISEHLDLAELIRSESSKRKGIDNTPSADVIDNLKKIAENVFEPIRNNFRVPIIISSGFRCIKLNESIGGADSSQHVKGEAIDIDMDGTPNGVSNAMIFHYIKDKLDFDQLIWEFGNNENPDWCHVSYSHTGKQRKEILKGYKENGKTHYSPYK